jgi:hypothetical protein
MVKCEMFCIQPELCDSDYLYVITWMYSQNKNVLCKNHFQQFYFDIHLHIELVDSIVRVDNDKC